DDRVNRRTKKTILGVVGLHERPPPRTVDREPTSSIHQFGIAMPRNQDRDIGGAERRQAVQDGIPALGLAQRRRSQEQRARADRERPAADHALPTLLLAQRRRSRESRRQRGVVRRVVRRLVAPEANREDRLVRSTLRQCWLAFQTARR